LVDIKDSSILLSKGSYFKKILESSNAINIMLFLTRNSWCLHLDFLDQIIVLKDFNLIEIIEPEIQSSEDLTLTWEKFRRSHILLEDKYPCLLKQYPCLLKLWPSSLIEIFDSPDAQETLTLLGSSPNVLKYPKSLDIISQNFRLCVDVLEPFDVNPELLKYSEIVGKIASVDFPFYIWVFLDSHIILLDQLSILLINHSQLLDEIFKRFSEEENILNLLVLNPALLKYPNVLSGILNLQSPFETLMILSNYSNLCQRLFKLDFNHLKEIFILEDLFYWLGALDKYYLKLPKDNYNIFSDFNNLLSIPVKLLDVFCEYPRAFNHLLMLKPEFLQKIMQYAPNFLMEMSKKLEVLNTYSDCLSDLKPELLRDFVLYYSPDAIDKKLLELLDSKRPDLENTLNN